MATTVILGSGIIGVSTAYYLSLSLPDSSTHLVEPSPQLFASASGFAGGFLAADWFSPSVAALGKLSFDEHRRLAEKFNGKEKWGYSQTTGVSYATGTRTKKGRGDDWLREGISRANTAGGSEFAGDDTQYPSWLTRVHGDNIEVITGVGKAAQVYVQRVQAHMRYTNR
jgi:glycine/D-amino acid oxidase-like deaminating enzyme